jgi:hypothetical protein
VPFEEKRDIIVKISSRICQITGNKDKIQSNNRKNEGLLE